MFLVKSASFAPHFESPKSVIFATYPLSVFFTKIFLAAKSLCTTFRLFKYSIPLAVSKILQESDCTMNTYNFLRVSIETSLVVLKKSIILPRGRYSVTKYEIPSKLQHHN